MTPLAAHREHPGALAGARHRRHRAGPDGRDALYPVYPVKPQALENDKW